MKKGGDALMKVLFAFVIVLTSAGVSRAELPGDFGGDLEKRPAPLKALSGVGATGYWRDIFAAGAEEIRRVFREEDGVGPFHNNLSSPAGAGCTSCHATQNGLGGYPNRVAAFYGFSGTGTTGESVFFPPQGLVLRINALSGSPLEVLPAWATPVDERKTPQIMGMGLVEAVPDQVFHDLAEANGGKVTVSPETGRVQRWGSQNQVATVLEFVDGAFATELGVTQEESESDDSLHPNVTGIDPEILVWQYLLLLDHPVEKPNPSTASQLGRAIFTQIGCATCHTPTLTTGPAPLEVNGITLDIDALKNVEFHPYSDYLLHDLGFAESDVHLGQAGRSEYRTAPLWGRRYDQNGDFHDQSQPNYRLYKTIERHGGEATGVKAAYKALSAREKDQLYRFVGDR